MIKPKPIDQETAFDIEELFFSTTDKHGIIRFGNDVFIRMSGYPTETMVGAPHNIVRHPDMPKAVFKLFWDFLKADLPIAAYVKNISADGRYYWVFAFAFPVADGYLSIRLKPTSPIFAAARSIYSRVLEREKKGDLPGAEKLLLEEVRQAGYADYRSFMIAATVAELQSRDRLLSERRSTAATLSSEEAGSASRVIRQIMGITENSSEKYRHLFANLEGFVQTSSTFRNTLDTLLQRFKRLSLLSINMTVSAQKFGQRGATLAVIATTFESLAADIRKNLENFSVAVNELSKGIQTTTQGMVSLKTQMDMAAFFVNGSLRSIANGGADLTHAFGAMTENRESFLALSHASFKDALSELQRLRGLIAPVVQAGEEVSQFVSGLESIRQTGTVESSRSDDIAGVFLHYIAEMKDFVQLLRKSHLEMGQATGTLLSTAAFLTDTISGMEKNVDQVFDLAFSLTSGGEEKKAA